MFDRIKKDIDSAIEKIKWFSAFFSERLNAEIMVFQLLYKSEKLKKRRDELIRKIGEEVYKMRGKDRNIYSNKDIVEAIRELEMLESQIKENIEKASEINKISV
jgi:ArsR family metal-binding transcriptional regulator